MLNANLPVSLIIVGSLLLGACAGSPTFFADDEVDVDGDGVLPRQGDCDDRNATVYAGHPEFCDGIDNDCDGLIDGLDDDLGDRDGDGSDACLDCDDLDPSRTPGADEICDGLDNNCDETIPVEEVDADRDGVALCAGDCDDDNAEVGPGFAEICDGLDSDCDALSDAEDPDVVDADLDGARACDDCDDGSAAVYPGAPELCDGRDNACAGGIPDDETDSDLDGFKDCEGDCDDLNALIYPGANELCNGLDDSCAGQLTSGEADSDGDGQSLCEGDCDDESASVHEGAVELCNGIDDDCVAGPELDEVDEDGDGQRVCGGDCDDSQALVFVGANELCNGIDDDCVGGVPTTEADFDGDGFRLCDGDCDDTAATVQPGGLELCNGVDDDCVAGVPVEELDSDGDGQSPCAGDCNDDALTIYLGALEFCNGVDDDCVGGLPPDEADGDQDGVSACAGDCDDADALRFPGNVETCSGIDEDCDDLTDGQDPDVADVDADGASICIDCDDNDPASAPNLSEVCGDLLDNDCDGLVDEPSPAVVLQGIATGRGDGALSLWTVNPLGGLGLPVQHGTASGNNALAVAAADLNGDGVVEILRQNLGDDDDSAAAEPYPIDRLSVLCDGTLGEVGVSGIQMVEQDRLIAAADLDADGDVDLLSIQLGTTNLGLVTAYLNDGLGSFSAASTGLTLVSPLTSGHWSLGRTPVDHTGDGVPDLVECGWTAGNHSLCLMHPGQGDGTFAQGTTIAVLQSPVHTVAQGDFNSDGAGDLLVGLSDRGDAGQLYFLEGLGNGSFALPTYSLDVNTEDESNVVAAEGRGLALPMDVDQDADLDLVVVWDTGVQSANRAIATALGNGSGDFSLGPVLSFVTDSPDPLSREWLAVPLP